MPISAKCKNCGRGYSVKNEHAGKKFRCQECQAAVTVPLPKPKADDDWESEDFSTKDYEDYDDYGDYESERRLPAPRRAAKKKKPVAKRKPTKKRSSARSDSGGIGAMIGKIGGGLFVGLFVMGIVARVISGGFDFGGSWQSYTTPDGNITVQLPGKAKSVPVLGQMAPGAQGFGAERRSFFCAVVIEPTPPEVKGLTEDEIFQAFELGSLFEGSVTNVKRSTINGHACVRYDREPKPGVKTSCATFYYKNKFYTLTYGYKGSKGSNEQKFFDSVQFN